MIVKELFAKLGLEVEEQAFEKAEALIGGLKSGMFGLVAGAAAVGLGLLELGRETANAAVDAYKLSLRLGTTTDAAQELKYAAEASGSSVESLTTAMFRMNRTIASAKGGSKEAQKALSGLGVPLDELYKMKPDEAFEKLAGGMSNVADASKKAEKEQGVFGRGVIDLIPLIEKGAEGIAHFREEAHEMGLVLSQETIQEAREWKREMRIAGEQVEALKYRVGAFVIHGVSKLTKAWAAWKQQHAEALLKTLKWAVFGLAAATAVWVSSTIGPLGALAASYFAAGTAALWSGAKAIWAGRMTALAWVGALAAMIPIGFWLNDLYHWFKGDKATFIQKVIDDWRVQFSSFGDVIRGVFEYLNHITGGKSMSEVIQDSMETPDQVNARVRRRRIERGVIDENGNPTAKGLGPSISGGLTPMNAFSPAATAPQATKPGSGVLAPTFNVTIPITQQPGQDPKELAGHVRTAIEDFHATKMREAAAAVE